MAITYLACMLATAHAYGLPPRVLPSIHAVEGGAVGTVHANQNATADLGVMQVNTQWIMPLSRYTGLTPEVIRYRLIYDQCFNVAAAGAILRSYVVEAHGDLLLAIGFYHSHTKPLTELYTARVTEAARRLFVSPR